MAKHGVWFNGFIRVAGVDLSDHAFEIRYTESSAVIPSHAMGDQYEFSKPGLFRIAASARFFQDFAANSVDATLDPLWRTRAEFSLVIGKDADEAVSSTNPHYSGLAFISSYSPVGGTHGDNLMAEVTFEPASDWSRLTA